ncbi:MAG TPA: serine/threonine-protein kinase [Ktedonobacteraceae bacterium]|nr:serine/threonine-protein kinase [Ktedonobacteraceae bacterium]
MDSLIGASIGGYTLIQVLGSGGMGTVYLAEDAAIGQQVAIKVVRTDPDSYTDIAAAFNAADRFKQEARAVASLDHLHILPLYRYGEEKTADGQLAYIIMQYRPEGSLWDWLRRRAELTFGQASNQLSNNSSMNLPFLMSGTWPLGLDEATEYLRQAASALQYAHERGIIHRDVKPANFLLRVEGGSTVYLLLSDFGLAKVYSANTSTSHILGTPIYMAPEQFEGAAVPESDQYSLAVMIYYCLAGRPPFEGEPMHLMNQHLISAPPLITVFNPTLPESVGRVLTRALAKNPDERFQSTAEFAAAFAQAAQDAPANVRPFLSLPTLSQTQRAAPFAPQLNYGAQPTPPKLNAGSAPQLVMPPTQAEEDYQRAFSAPLPSVMTPQLQAPPQPQLLPQTPPGKPGAMSRRSALGWIIGGAAVVAVGGSAGFYFYSRSRQPDNAKFVLRGHSDVVTSIFWSPDGAQLVSGSRDKTARLWIVANQQNTVTYSGHSAAVRCVVWGPGGLLLASGSEDETVQLWDSGGVRRHTYGPLGAAVSTIAWDAQAGAILAGTLGNGGRTLPLTGGVITRSLTRSVVNALALSADDTYLAAALANGDVGVYTTQAPRTTVFGRKLTGAALCLAWSPDGTKLAAGSANNYAEVWDIAGRIIKRLPHKAPVNGVAWNPAGNNQLATCASDGTVNIWDIASLAKTTFSGYGGAINSVAWSTGGLATGDANNNVIVWQV